MPESRDPNLSVRATRNRLPQALTGGAPSSLYDTWHRLWWWLGGLAALMITLVDAVLLQRKLNFFTGGFLTTDYLHGYLETGIFLLSSLVADAGITLPLAAIGIWIFSSARLSAKPSTIAIMLIATGPLLVADFMLYRLHEFLGDAFDLALSFEIAGRNAAEIAAVAAPHLVAPLMLLLGAGFFLVGLTWLSKRILPGGWIALPKAPTLKRFGLENLAVFLLALCITCLANLSNDTIASGLEHKPSGSLFSYIGDRLSDVDSDGYGVLRRPRDPAPFDGNIFPYAIDIPGNGIDEDGIAGDLAVDTVVQSPQIPGAVPWTRHPNVIMIVLESFRADIINATYQGKPITPVLNALAREGVSAPLAFSHNGYTTTSRYHMFTGRLGYMTGAPGLIDDFKANHYQVAYFSAQDESFGGERLDIGFSRSDVAYDARSNPELRYTAFSTPGSIALPWGVMVDKITDFLKKREDRRPLMLQVNLQDAHYPYHHNKIRPMLNSVALARASIRPERAEQLRATYANTAANVDYAVGEIIKQAKRQLHDPSPAIIVLADHGESLFDDEFLGHGQVINDVQMRIPLIVANLPMKIRQPFGQADLRGALLAALESDAPAKAAPQLITNESSPVFQYLGDLKRPRQIALRGASSQTLYDFRTGRVRLSNGEWRTPDELTPVEYQTLESLINQWQRMLQ